MEYLLKVSSVVVIFYFVYKVFLQRDTFFQSNRGFLLLGLISSFIIPLLVIPVYIEYIPNVIENYNLSEVIPIVENTEEPFNILSHLPIVYLVGVLLFSCRFIIQFASLLKIIFKNKSEKQGIFRFVKINDKISPFSFFNWIFYNPNQFNKIELDQIIAHEKEHAQQFHSIDVLLMQLSCIVLWFNPFIWLYNNTVKQNLEFIADQKTQVKFNCKKSYQNTLLKTSMPSHQMALSNNFYNSLIKKRIIMLHKSKSKKINLIKYALVIPLLALFLMGFNTKEVYIEIPNSENDVRLTQKDSTRNNVEQFIIHNDFDDAKLKAFEDKLKSKGYGFNLENIGRGINGLITSIDFIINKNGVDGRYRIASARPIKTIVIEYSKIENKFIINTLDFIKNQNRNANNRELIEIIIDKNTTISDLVNKKKLLKDKYNIIFNFKIFEQDSENEIPIYSYEIGEKGAMHGTTTSVDNPLVIKYDPKTNSISRHGINKNGDPTYGSIHHLAQRKSHIIMSYYNDQNIENIVKTLKEKGITVKFSNIVRNDKDEIISITINAKSKYGNINFNTSSDEPIIPIAISHYGIGKGLKIGPSLFSKNLTKKIK